MRKIVLFGILILAGQMSAQVNTFSKEANAEINKRLESQKATFDASLSPLIVVDGKPVNGSEAGTLKASEIETVSTMPKSNTTGMVIWGEKARDGVVLVRTKAGSAKAGKNPDKSKILYIKDAEIISETEMQDTNPDNIKSVSVYKEPGRFRMFNGSEYDGVIAIVTK